MGTCLATTSKAGSRSRSEKGWPGMASNNDLFIARKASAVAEALADDNVRRAVFYEAMRRNWAMFYDFEMAMEACGLDTDRVKMRRVDRE